MAENDTKACCEYCGQVLLFEGSVCDCGEAVKDRARLVAIENTKLAFGAACSQKGLEPCSEEAVQILITLALAAIDEHYFSAAINLGAGIKAHIGLNKDGLCVIRRKDSSEISLIG
jgi:hypothetical protein